MNGCIYRTASGECDLYAEGGKYTAFCEMENCAGRKMSNADEIRAMTDEELADFIIGVCHAVNNQYYGVRRELERGRIEFIEWLKSPAEGEP